MKRGLPTILLGLLVGEGGQGDDDDENTFTHEAGRNFSIPHQENNPFLPENTHLIRETIFSYF